MPVFQRLGELRPIAETKLRQFGAGNHAGLTALSMSEAAIADWIQKISLGSTIEPTQLVTEFEIGSETIRFLTGEREDAKDLRGFDHASRLVGLVAAGVTLGPPLEAGIGALIVTEAPLLAFAARIGLSRLLMWGATNPVVSGYGGQLSTVQSLRANPVVGPQIAGLSEDEVVAILGYTGSDYVEVNTALRSKDPQQMARMQPYIQMLQNALAKLPDHGGTVFRGASLTQTQVDRYVPGTVVEEEAFTSTSYDQGAKFGGNVEFEIRSRTGTRIDFLSRFPSEKEVLLAAGTRLKVVSKTYDATTNRWPIVMEETP